MILQRQPLHEHDWLLDVFSEQRGRLSVVLPRPLQAPDLFCHYQCDWHHSADWPRIRGWQSQQAWPLQGMALYCGLYLNELLVRLLPRADAAPELFRIYQATLAGLQQPGLPDPWLRVFEWQLLQQLGYGFSWQHDSDAQPLQPERYYRFEPGRGFVAAASGLSGAGVLAFSTGSRDLAVWRLARQVLRQALDDVLQQPLCSRDLLQAGTLPA